MLVGSLPEFPRGFSFSTQLSVTFDIVGEQVVALGRAQVGCISTTFPVAQLGEGFSFVAAGTIAADGTFTAASPSVTTSGVAVSSVQLTGSVPAEAGQPWSGTYAINPSGSCPQQVAGAVSATPIASVTGTYAGSGTFTQGAVQTPFTATMNLTQGNTSTSAGATVTDATALSGTISISGLSCFHTGTLQLLPTTSAGVQRSVQGAALFPVFTMDDGSTLISSMEIHDTQATQLDADALLVIGGSCDSKSSQLRVGNFVRQH